MASSNCKVSAASLGVAITDNVDRMPVEVAQLTAIRYNNENEVVYSIPEGETCEVLQIDFCLALNYEMVGRCDYALVTSKWLYIGEMKLNLQRTSDEGKRRKVRTNLSKSAAQLRSSYDCIPELSDPTKKVAFLIHFPDHLRFVLSDYLATEYPRSRNKIEDLDYLILNSSVRVLSSNFIVVDEPLLSDEEIIERYGPMSASTD